jgi:hypothetical protein
MAEEKSIMKAVPIEGPIMYSYCRFKVNGRDKIVHYFGDRHVNQTRCKRDVDPKPIPLTKLIENTIQVNPDKEIDVFFERGFGSLETYGIEEYPYESETMPYIEYTYRYFEKEGCFHKPRDARCKRKYQNARFHNTDFRQTLHADVLHFLKE